MLDKTFESVLTVSPAALKHSMWQRKYFQQLLALQGWVSPAWLQSAVMHQSRRLLPAA